jgi:hypothetical protein
MALVETFLSGSFESRWILCLRKWLLSIILEGHVEICDPYSTERSCMQQPSLHSGPGSSSPSPFRSFSVTNLVHALAFKCYLCKFIFHSWTLSRVFVSCVVKQLSPNDCFPSVPTRPTFLTTGSTVSYHFHLSIEAAFRTSLTNLCSLGCETDNVSQDLTFDEQFSSDPKSTTVKY